MVAGLSRQSRALRAMLRWGLPSNSGLYQETTTRWFVGRSETIRCSDTWDSDGFFKSVLFFGGQCRDTVTTLIIPLVDCGMVLKQPTTAGELEWNPDICYVTSPPISFHHVKQGTRWWSVLAIGPLNPCLTLFSGARVESLTCPTWFVDDLQMGG